ncbi:triadin isoform X1 [Amia ocellicauda]|uniref:triadin isoform X1 n=1 Tax=Amia ocellicauda TaxID=2972642 RepID=UPI0034639F7F
MTELTAEGRPSATTTAVIDSKNGSILQSSIKSPKKSVTEDLASTFSSPTAWLLVIALIVTWSAVAVIMFDLIDCRGYVGRVHMLSSDPMKLIDEAVEESTDWVYGVMSLLSDMISPDDDDDDDDEGDMNHPLKRKGEENKHIRAEHDGKFKAKEGKTVLKETQRRSEDFVDVEEQDEEVEDGDDDSDDAQLEMEEGEAHPAKRKG